MCSDFDIIFDKSEKKTADTAKISDNAIINGEVIIGENVKGLSKRLTSDGKKFIDIIKKEFENIGYDIDFFIKFERTKEKLFME